MLPERGPPRAAAGRRGILGSARRPSRGGGGGRPATRAAGLRARPPRSPGPPLSPLPSPRPTGSGLARDPTPNPGCMDRRDREPARDWGGAPPASYSTKGGSLSTPRPGPGSFSRILLPSTGLYSPETRTHTHCSSTTVGEGGAVTPQAPPI